MKRPIKVRVTLDVEVDPDAYAEAYGMDVAEARLDAVTHLQETVFCGARAAVEALGFGAEVKR